MSILTFTSVALILLGAFTRLGWPRALGIAGGTPAGAALVVGEGVAIPTYAFVALAAVGVFVGGELARARRTGLPTQRLPGVLALVVFFCWVVAVTLVAPILFDGYAVTGPAVGEIHVLNSGAQPATSNIAQVSYLALGIGTLVIVARDARTRISAVALTLVTATVLSTWALVHRDLGVPFPEGVFDNSPSFRYISTAAGGFERFRGIFPEPAALAGVSLAAVAFFVASLPGASGVRRVLTCVVLAFAVWNISVSTATTALISGLALLTVAGMAFTYRFVLRRQRVSALFITALCVVGVVLLPLLPIISNSISSTIDDKVGTSSFDDRSTADSFSYDLTVKTFGLGVGLGSNRPSSLMAGLLSTTGVFGTALFLGTIAYIVWRSLAYRETRPVMWAFVSFMITRFISSPDLGDPTGLTWLSLGAMIGITVSQPRRGASSGRMPSPPRVVHPHGPGVPVDLRPRMEETS